MKVTRFVFLTVLLVVAMASAQAAIIFQNSFASGNETPYDTVAGGGTIGPWSVGGAGVDWIHTYWAPQDADGGSLDMSSTGAGSVSASFATVIGNPYLVTFWMAGNPDGSPSVGRNLSVLATGGSSSPYTFGPPIGSAGDMGWTMQSYNFVASSATTTLTFTSLENNSYGAALDNVIVQDAREGEVPEPGTYALMAAGLAGIAFLRRKR